MRAAEPDEAREIASILDRVRPRLLAILPGAREDAVEVWMQDQPHLFHFPRESASDAEGLYAPTQDRILLSRGLADTERVLAHELVHATLDATWEVLPGTLEEGLCDAVAARISSVGVARLRAGRLSSAALVCGGIQLDVDVQLPASSTGERDGWSARVSLSSEEHVEDPQHEVFRVAAGLSSTRLEGNVKRGLYGLSFLLVDRVLDRIGLEGLHALCLRATEQGLERVPRPWLLEAAGLDDDTATWRAQACAGLGSEELLELARLYPAVVADAALAHVGAEGLDLEGARIELSVRGAGARVRVEDLPEVRAELARRLSR